MDTLQKLNALFGKQEKKKFSLLFILMIIAALFETAGVGLIVPFVGIATNPNIIQENAILSYIYNTLGFQSINTFAIVAAVALLAFFALKNLYLLWFHYIQYRVIYNEQVKMSRRLFQAYMLKPYTFHLQRNSAQLLRNTTTEVQKIFKNILKSMFLFFTEILVVLSIVILLIVMAPIPAIISGIVLGASVGIFFKIFNKRIMKSGKTQQRTQGEMIQWVNQGLGAVKDVHVLGRESFFVDQYTDVSKEYASAMRFYELIKTVPRFFIETIIVATILLIVILVMIQSQDTSALIATISLFAMAAFRLAPSVTKMAGAQTTIRNSRPALDVVYNDLVIDKIDRNVPDFQSQPEIIINQGENIFKDSINVENVSFRYPGSDEKVLNNINLKIPIGQSVAFVGPSGSGKTTIVDIILGVLQPSQGLVTIDGKDIQSIESIWKQKIGYIPQFIYLSDDNIRNNVAFGLPNDKIDNDAVWRALKQAQLDEFVDGLPDKADTFIGERGVRLSGGQRQRIGIARALYHNPEILFMDEATSALDNETEKEVMKAIDGLRGDKTLIIIAHRLSTIENCDIVFELEMGKLKISRDNIIKER